MAITNIRFSFLVFSTFLSLSTKAALLPANRSELNEQSNPQMINLNLQFKAHNKVVKSDLAMPYYQTAELEKKMGNKNVFIEVNPRHGKNEGEVAIEMRFYKASGLKAFAKKEIIAKIGEESKVSVKGLSVKVTPALN